MVVMLVFRATILVGTVIESLPTFGGRRLQLHHENTPCIALVGMSTREPPIGFADRVGGSNDDLAIGTRPDACPSSHVTHLVVARAEFHTVFTHFPSPLPLA